MRIDLPQCDFAECRLRFDGNCRSNKCFENCKYQQLKNSCLKIEHIDSESGDWQWLYINGVLACEGHSIPVYKVIAGINQFLPLDFCETEIPQEEAEMGLPKFREYPF